MKKFLSSFLAAGIVASGAWAQPSNPVGPLPVRSVTLFSSGVAFTMREGDIDGDATVPLSFRTAQMNDILKSLVLLDEKGTVQPVIYGAKDPINRTLQSFAVDVTQPLTRSQLLIRLRGQKVEVTIEAPNRTTSITGQIVSIETKTIILEGNRVVVIELLNLLTDQGLEAVSLDEASNIKFVDEKVNREFREALTLLASGADDRRRQVTLRFSGNSRRKVRVGYISESPLWKISYRLLITDTATEKPYIQGWALVENTTDEDWVNVRLSLVSGRPISFIQDLYQPLYLPRPVVPPDIVASPFPQIAEGSMDDRNESLALNSAAPPPPSVPMAPKPSAARSAAPGGGVGGGFGGGGFGGRGGGVAAMADGPAAPEAKISSGDMANTEAQATGQRAGELFQYNITAPVTLPRQQAAMIPVVARDIEGQKVALYNADTGPRYPLNAFRLKNNTALFLKGGPVTVFDGGIYAGDARMEDIPPGDTRLITYAVDLTMEGERQGDGSTSVETGLRIKEGVLTISRREQVSTKYTLKNKGDKPRTALIEHPFNPEFTLVAPKQPTERTPSLYRFEVTVPAGKSGTLSVVQERPIAEGIALLNGDINTLQIYVTRDKVPEKIKVALQGVVTRRLKIGELQAQLKNTEAEIQAIDNDQDRIRKNMSPLDRASALYKRYVQQLDEQETKIQNLRQEATRLRKAVADAEQELRTYINTIDI